MKHPCSLAIYNLYETNTYMYNGETKMLNKVRYCTLDIKKWD